MTSQCPFMIFLYKSAEIVDDLLPAEAVLHLEALRDTLEPLEHLYPICFDLTFLDTLRNLAEELLANIAVVWVGRPVERTVAVLFQKGRPDKDVCHLGARSTVSGQRIAWPDGADGGSFIGFHDVGTQGTRALFAYGVSPSSNHVTSLHLTWTIPTTSHPKTVPVPKAFDLRDGTPVGLRATYRTLTNSFFGLRARRNA